MQSSHANSGFDQAIADLRTQLAGLEADAAALKRDLSHLIAAVREAEGASIAAVLAGDDGEARIQLEIHQRQVDAAAVVRAELASVLALIDTCRETLTHTDPKHAV